MRKEDREQDRIDDEVAKTLASLDGLEDIDVGPHFFTRLQANLSSSVETPQPLLLRFLFAGRPVPALLAVMVVINIVTAVVVLRNSRVESSLFRSTHMEVLSEQYLLMGTFEDLNASSE